MEGEHSGRRYAAATFRAILATHGIEAIMSRKGNGLDRVVAESFFSNLENEVVQYTVLAERRAARAAIFDCV